MSNPALRTAALAMLTIGALPLAGCGDDKAPTQTTAVAPAAPAAPEMTAGQRMQDRRADVAQQQIEAQMQAQMQPAPAVPATTRP